VFPEEAEDEYNEFKAKMLTWYWLPEGAVQKHAATVPYLEWQKQGWLRVIPDSDVIDYSFVQRDIAELCERYDIQMIAYDKKYSYDIMQRLADKHAETDDSFYAFDQTIMTYAGPTAQFERMILAGDLQHDGNAITTWQAGHVEVKTDANDNRRPIKPERNEMRKVDGIVAGIMALDAAGRIDGLVGESFYESHGLETT
jgi:phage terminase large subunit-like protein